MKPISIEDINLMIIVFSIISVFNIFLGLAIKKYKIAEIISGYDSERDDPEMVCNLTGSNMALMGVLGLLLCIIYFILREKLSPVIFAFSYVAIIVGLCANIYIRWSSYNRKNKKQ